MIIRNARLRNFGRKRNILSLLSIEKFKVFREIHKIESLGNEGIKKELFVLRSIAEVLVAFIRFYDKRVETTAKKNG